MGCQGERLQAVSGTWAQLPGSSVPMSRKGKRAGSVCTTETWQETGRKARGGRAARLELRAHVARCGATSGPRWGSWDLQLRLPSLPHFRLSCVLLVPISGLKTASKRNFKKKHFRRDVSWRPEVTATSHVPLSTSFSRCLVGVVDLGGRCCG